MTLAHLQLLAESPVILFNGMLPASVASEVSRGRCGRSSARERWRQVTGKFEGDTETAF